MILATLLKLPHEPCVAGIKFEADSSTLKYNCSFPLLSYVSLTLKVLNFGNFTSYCSLKPLWSGMGKVVPARTSQTLHPPSPPTVHQLS